MKYTQTVTIEVDYEPLFDAFRAALREYGRLSEANVRLWRLRQRDAIDEADADNLEDAIRRELAWTGFKCRALMEQVDEAGVKRMLKRYYDERDQDTGDLFTAIDEYLDGEGDS